MCNTMMCHGQGKEMPGKRYTCEACRGTFISPASDEEAQAEHAQRFPEIGPKAELAEICDDCYDKFLKWIAAHPEERQRHGW